MTTLLASSGREATLAYYGGSEMKANVFIEKYAKRDDAGEVIEWTGEESALRWGTAAGYTESSPETQMLASGLIVPGGRIQHALGAYKRASLKNCYVYGVKDSIDGIFDWCRRAARTYSYGGGVGTCIGKLRPHGAKVRNSGGYSSGAASFSDLFSTTTGTVQQHGRRGALMLLCPDNHPDILRFIRMKDDVKPEWLHAARNIDGGPNVPDGLFAWMGQRRAVRYANISVKVSDALMRLVEADDPDADWALTFRTTSGESYTQSVKALDLWNELVEHAWASGDPGIVFWDHIKAESPSDRYAGYEVIATNPCFTGDTKVWTAEHGHALFRDLVGKTVSVLTQTSEGRLAYRPMHNIRCTQREAALVRVSFDNGTSIRCTPQHRYYLRDGREVAAQDLVAGDSVCSVYRYRANTKGYMRLSNGAHTPLEHHIPFEGVDALGQTVQVHHLNEVKSDNRPSNLCLMDAAEHRRLHMDGDANPLRKYPDRNPMRLDPDCTRGDKNGRWRDDVDTQGLIEARSAGLSYRAISKAFGCSPYTARKRVVEANHRVVSVEWLSEREDVYCGTVDDPAHRFFVALGDNDGVLVANCGEQPLGDNGDACLLSHIGLHLCVSRPFTPSASIDWARLERATRANVRFLDRLNTIEDEDDRYPNPEVKQTNLDIRRIGCGTIGLAEMFIQLGLPYGSDASIHTADEVYERIVNWQYQESAKLAAELGPFRVYDWERHKNVPMMSRLRGDTVDMIRKHGLRNVTVNTVAPTGTCAMLAPAPIEPGTSGGIEPFFEFSYTRRVYNAERIARAYTLHEPVVLRWCAANKRDPRDIEDITTCGKEWVGAHKIDWRRRVEMQATIQRWIDTSISSTINVPNHAEPKMIGAIYREAWRQGCKGLTVYREGSRDEVLSTITKELAGQMAAKADDLEAAKRNGNGTHGNTIALPSPTQARVEDLPESIEARRIAFRDGRHNRVLLTLGFNAAGDKPIEVVIQHSKTDSDLNSLASALGIIVSVALQEGVPVARLAKGLRGLKADFVRRIKLHPSDDTPVLITSVPDAIAVALQRFREGLSDDRWCVEIEGAALCPLCRQRALVREGGCQACRACSYSLCS